MPDLNENQHHVSTHKSVLTGKIRVNGGISARRNAEIHLTPCSDRYYFVMMRMIATLETKFTAII